MISKSINLPARSLQDPGDHTHGNEEPLVVGHEVEATEEHLDAALQYQRCDEALLASPHHHHAANDHGHDDGAQRIDAEHQTDLAVIESSLLTRHLGVEGSDLRHTHVDHEVRDAERNQARVVLTYIIRLYIN